MMRLFFTVLVLTLMLGSIGGSMYYWGFIPAAVLAVVWGFGIYFAVWGLDLFDLNESYKKGLVAALLPLVLLLGIGVDRLAVQKPAVPETAAKNTEEKTFDTLAQNMATVSDEVEEFKIETLRKFAKQDDRIDNLQSRANEDHQLLQSIVVPPPPAEADIPLLPLPSEPTFETVPKAKKPEPKKEAPLPKARELPSSEPKQYLPELRAQTRKHEDRPDEPPTHVLGTCGRAHRITSWTADGQAQYGPCYDIVGQPACSFVRFGVMNWK